MPRRKDIWRCGVIQQPLADLLGDRALADADVRWIDVDRDFTFLADPFAWQDGITLNVFAEFYDYRSRKGVIELISFDAEGRQADRVPCLSEPWHLSYPFVFEGEGSVWMLPEAHRSGRLTLYRMGANAADWVAECIISLDAVPVDASPLWHGGRWWLFYSPANCKATRMGHLHVAWAERLSGPWTPHPGNPVRVDPSSARPGGTPVVIGERIMLPVQDCATTYGGAVRPLWIDCLDEVSFVAQVGDALPLPATAVPYIDGMHTLSACGDVTLLDVKLIDRSARGLLLDLKRKLGRYG